MVIGIDPGVSGAVAVLSGDRLISVVDTPVTKIGKTSKRAYNEQAMSDLLRHARSINFDLDGCEAIIEQASVRPGQHSQSGLKIGIGFGLWCGILVGLGIPYTISYPHVWKKRAEIPTGSDKEASVDLAAQLYPDAPLYGPNGGAKDGRADAILIATYGT